MDVAGLGETGKRHGAGLRWRGDARRAQCAIRLLCGAGAAPRGGFAEFAAQFLFQVHEVVAMGPAPHHGKVQLGQSSAYYCENHPSP